MKSFVWEITPSNLAKYYSSSNFLRDIQGKTFIASYCTFSLQYGNCEAKSRLTFIKTGLLNNQRRKSLNW